MPDDENNAEFYKGILKIILGGVRRVGDAEDKVTQIREILENIDLE